MNPGTGAFIHPNPPSNNAIETTSLYFLHKIISCKEVICHSYLMYRRLFQMAPLLLPILVHAQGHDLCNNSAGFRFVKNTLTTDTEALESYPDILHKIETDQLLNDDEYVFFSVKYVQNSTKKAGIIAKKTIQDALAENAISHPTLLTRNNAMAMDMIMSEGLNPDNAIALTRTTADADTDIISFTQQKNITQTFEPLKTLSNAKHLISALTIRKFLLIYAHCYPTQPSKTPHLPK